MADIVLAIPEGAFTVLPRLAPVNRRQDDKQRIAAVRCRAPGVGLELAAYLELVFLGRVMKYGGRTGEAGRRQQGFSKRRHQPSGKGIG